MGRAKLDKTPRQRQRVAHEATGNDPGQFKVYRRAGGEPRGKKRWHPLRRGVADMPRRAQVSRAASARHLEAFAQIDCDETLNALVSPLCKPARHRGKPVRAPRPFEAMEMEAPRALNNADYCLHGLRSRDMRKALGAHMPAEMSAAAKAAEVARMLVLFRGHGLLRKVGRTHRCQVTPKRRKIITSLMSASRVSAKRLSELVT